MVKYKKIPFGVRMNYVIYTGCWGMFLRDSGFVQPGVQLGHRKSAEPVNSTLGLKMSEYNFRVRFNLANGLRINSDESKIELGNHPSGVTLFLVSGQTGVPIKECPRVAVTGKGFDTIEEAQLAAENCKRTLLYWAVKFRHGIDLGDGRQRSLATNAGLALLEQEHGCPFRNDIHGIDVYKHIENLKFIHVDMQAVAQKNPDHLIEAFKQEKSLDRKLSEKQALACEIYSSSWFDVSFRSRFITLVTAIEALVTQEEHPAEVGKFVKSAKSELKSLPIQDDVKVSINGSLERLRFQSISQAGKLLVQRLLPDAQYQGMSACDYFTKCYGLRSQILHNGVADGNEDMLQLANATEEFVANLLLASLGSESEH